MADSSRPTSTHGEPALPNIPPRPSPGIASDSASSSPPRTSYFDQQESSTAGGHNLSPGDPEARRQWRRQRDANRDVSGGHEVTNSSRPSSTAPIDDSEVPTPVNPSDLDSVPITDEQKARIIDRHLNLPDSSSFSQVNHDGESNFTISREPTRSPGAAISGGHHVTFPGSPSGSNYPTEEGSNANEYFTPHHMQGGAITSDIYRWANQNRRKAQRRTRSESVHLPRTAHIDPDLDVEGIKEPGGFRRFFMLREAERSGQPPPRALRSFIDFLSLYGHFAGEDLEDDDDDDETETEGEDDPEAGGHGAASTSREANTGGTTERSALLRRPSNRRRGTTRGADGSKPRGEASVTEAVMMLLKSFVGTGVLFLGKAFFNGGLLFSSVVLCAVALISLFSFLLLVKANLKVPASFGDMGGKLYGPKMRLAILTSIVFSQLGFVAAYTVFVAQNLQAFVLGVTHCKTFIPTVWFILLQMAIFVPLSLVRKIAKLSSTALIADAFILFGIVYLFQYEIRTLLDNGLADVKQFNSKSFPLFVGTAVFTFEGVGLVIPITESMKEPQRFPKALSGVMVVVMILFTTSGALSYGAFGSKTQTVVITNLPQDSKFVQAMLFLYSVAILLSTPLQLFPAVTVLERGLFGKKNGKYNTKVKFLKNLFRSSTVLLSCLFAWLGSSSLDVFVSFIGSVFCVPLCFIFPPLLSLKAMPERSWLSKSGDVGILAFGVVAMAFSGSQSVKTLLFGAGGEGEGFTGSEGPMCTPP